MSIARELRARVSALGSDFNPVVLKATQDTYRPHLDLESGRVQRDLRYGPAERQRLDVYAPLGDSKGLVVYVHGGGFVGGDKNVDGHFYANVGSFFARQGYTAVLPCYRLAPSSPWPAAAHDVRDVVRWVAENLHMGTVPLFVIGQSAGASHVASWLFDADTREAALGDIAGVVLMSGFYVAEASMSSNAVAYFGADPAHWHQRSPLSHVTRLNIPLCLTVAELDPGPIAAHTFRLAQALALADGKAPQVRWLAGHNHASTVMSIGSPQSDVGDVLIEFLQAHAARQGDPQ